MIIVEIDSTDDCGPIRVCAFGSCRLIGPLHASADLGLAKIIWSAPSFGHHISQALQNFQIINGRKELPRHFEALAFLKTLDERGYENLQKGGVELNNIDIFIVELCTRNQFSCDGFQFNSDYIQEVLVRPGKMPMLKWWRSLNTGTENHLKTTEITLNSIEPSTIFEHGQISDLLNKMQMDVKSDSELKSEINNFIAETEKPLIMVPIFNFPSLPDPNRFELFDMLERNRLSSNFHIFDPTFYINEVGIENALASSGNDINHYESKFQNNLAREFINFIQDVAINVASGQPPLNHVFDFPRCSESFSGVKVISNKGWVCSQGRDTENTLNSLDATRVKFLSNSIHDTAGVSFVLPSDRLDQHREKFPSFEIGKYTFSFFARIDREYHNFKLKVFTGIKYIILEQSVTQNYTKFKVTSTFKFDSSEIRIGFMNPSEGMNLFIIDPKLEHIGHANSIYSNQFDTVVSINDSELIVEESSEDNSESATSMVHIGFKQDEVDPGAGVYFNLSKEFLHDYDGQKPSGKFCFSFKAKLNRNNSDIRLKIYTGSKYVELEMGLSQELQEFDLEEIFDFTTSSPYRIGFLNASKDDYLTICSPHLCSIK